MHLADITYVKLVLPRLVVYTNTRRVTFHCTDAAKLREMTSRIKGELSCAQLRSWFDKSANLKLRDDNSDPLLLRSESRDRVVGANEKRELQASIEALRSRHNSAHPADQQLAAPPAVVLDSGGDVVTSPRRRKDKDEGSAIALAASTSDESANPEQSTRTGSKVKEDRTCQSCRKQKAKMRVEATDANGVQRNMLLCRACLAELQPGVQSGSTDGDGTPK